MLERTTKHVYELEQSSLPHACSLTLKHACSLTLKHACRNSPIISLEDHHADSNRNAQVSYEQLIVYNIYGEVITSKIHCQSAKFH